MAKKESYGEVKKIWTA